MRCARKRSPKGVCDHICVYSVGKSRHAAARMSVTTKPLSSNATHVSRAGGCQAKPARCAPTKPVLRITAAHAAIRHSISLLTVTDRLQCKCISRSDAPVPTIPNAPRTNVYWRRPTAKFGSLDPGSALSLYFVGAHVDAAALNPCRVAAVEHQHRVGRGGIADVEHAGGLGHVVAIQIRRHVDVGATGTAFDVRVRRGAYGQLTGAAVAVHDAVDDRVHNATGNAGKKHHLVHRCPTQYSYRHVSAQHPTD